MGSLPVATQSWCSAGLAAPGLAASLPLAHLGFDALEEGRVGGLPAGAGASRHGGEAAGGGLGSAVQGHPAEAEAGLGDTLGAFGIPFRAGELILSGSLAPLVPARAGERFEMEIEGLGSCSIAFS